MRRINKTFFLLFFFFFTCNSKENEKTILRINYEQIYLRKDFEKILDDFLKENNCDSCIYELTIRKSCNTETYFLLGQTYYNLEYLKKRAPLYYLKYKGKSLYIYSGMEDFFNGNNEKLLNKRDTIANYSDYWEVLIENDSIEKVIKNHVDPVIKFYPKKEYTNEEEE